MNNKICIFLHVPKCAGTSIVHSMTHKLNKDVFVAKSHGTEQYMPIDMYLSLFKHVPIKAFDAKIIAGHLLFGLHRQTKKSCTYITMMRHPVDRLWSQYCYMRKLGINNKRCRGCDTLVNSEMSFETFISLPGPLPLGNFGCIPNLQTLIIAGEQSSTMLDKAKQNIKNYFTIIGVQEQFEHFKAKLSQYLGISLSNLWLNKKNDPQSDDILSIKIKNKIKQRDVLDIELYNYVRGIL